MEFVEYRAVLKFLVKKGLSFVSVKAEFQSVYGSDKVSESFIRKYAKKFKHGRDNIFDEPRSRRPMEVDHSGIASRVRSIVLIDCYPELITIRFTNLNRNRSDDFFVSISGTTVKLMLLIINIFIFMNSKREVINSYAI